MGKFFIKKAGGITDLKKASKALVIMEKIKDKRPIAAQKLKDQANYYFGRAMRKVRKDTDTLHQGINEAAMYKSMGGAGRA